MPARNEEARIRKCLDSLVSQTLPVQVMLSDNASDDSTVKLAAEYSDRLDIAIRSTEPLGPSEHMVSAGMWGLRASGSELFALLAGDDEWGHEFAAEAVRTLDQTPQADAVFPSFQWPGRPSPGDRRLSPRPFAYQLPTARRFQALLLPSHGELANLVYGVYRRTAFEALLTAWSRAGEDFASDYAAVFCVLGRHRVTTAPRAISYRHVRSGEDLLARVGLSSTVAPGVIPKAKLFVAINLRLNSGIADAIGRTVRDGWRPTAWQVHVVRSPQWLWRALLNVATRRSAPTVPTTGVGSGSSDGAQSRGRDVL